MSMLSGVGWAAKAAGQHLLGVPEPPGPKRTWYSQRTLLGAKGIATRSKDATIGAPGHTTGSKDVRAREGGVEDATRSKGPWLILPN